MKFGETEGCDPDEDIIIIHLGHISQERYGAVLKSVTAFMNARWPNVGQIGMDS